MPPAGYPALQYLQSGRVRNPQSHPAPGVIAAAEMARAEGGRGRFRSHCPLSRRDELA